jgi:hypothetical protein
MIDLMHGPQFAKTYVTNYLSVDLPRRLVQYRNGWGISEGDLPAPLKYLNYEPIALDDLPTIITVAISTASMERIDFDRQHPIYRVTYNMRTYVWVKTEGSEQTTDMRDRLTTVVRSALLDKPCLNATDPRSTFQAMIDETSMREEFSDLTLLKGDRVLAGAYLAYDMHINEIVMREPISTLSEIELTVLNTSLENRLRLTATPGEAYG